MGRSSDEWAAEEDANEEANWVMEQEVVMAVRSMLSGEVSHANPGHLDGSAGMIRALWNWIRVLNVYIFPLIQVPEDESGGDTSFGSPAESRATHTRTNTMESLLDVDGY